MRAWMSKGKMHFDEEAWAMIKKHARKQHKTPKQIVIAALKRSLKLQEKVNCAC